MPIIRASGGVLSSNGKINTLDQLLSLRAEARRQARTVVHCHGCFDIVHPGHIAYLQFARRQGDILLVSLTADRQVNKGADRPLIPQDLRAEALAALECVDWVYVNPDPTAVDLLEAVQPDFYVKGREYESNSDPRFLAERDTVTRHGGRVLFSSGEVIYSSTALIGVMDANGAAGALQQEKIRRFRSKFELDDGVLWNLRGRFAGKKVLVIGDYILDRYHHCDANSIAAEGPMMSLRRRASEEFDGGAAVIALHLAGLGASAVLLSALTQHDESRQVEMRLGQSGVMVDCLKQRRQLVSKSRYLAEGSKLFKVDEGEIEPLDSRSEAELAEKILGQARGADAVIFADFGYGAITGGLMDRIATNLRQQVPILCADVSGMGSNLLRFKEMDLLCPTERETRQAMNDFSSGLNAAAWALLTKTGARQAIITLGKQGLIAFDQHVATRPGESWERHLRGEHLPALCSRGRAVDPLGCGDALLATATLTLAAGGSLHAAAYLGSLAAALEAEQSGNRPITSDQLLSRLQPPMPAVRLAS
jgi:rfaE bifunctional protein kinase chain/domain/rfaE bifunctional protein nucleotidyltransferase chain/domain